ncbi:MAG: alanine racemase [Nitrospinota bacterium]
MSVSTRSLPKESLPTYSEIDLNAFSYNLQQVRLKVGRHRKIIAVIKADAYGHGAVEIARTASVNGADMLGVSTVDEGGEIRKAGIGSPILVLSGCLKGDKEGIVLYNLNSVVYLYETVLSLSKEAEKAGKVVSVHIKVDTGMERIGIQPDKVREFIRAVNSLPHIKIEGILTHFAASYEQDKSFTEQQIKIFKDLIDELRQDGYQIPVVHASNSAAIVNYPDSYFNAVRPGIILYGSLPFDFPLPPFASPSKGGDERGVFKPVMRWKTEIIHLHTVPKGTGISYGRRFITKRDSIIATIPVGYADGYSRSLSNRAQVLVRGMRVPQVGTICMDMCMIDVTDLRDVTVGDEVVLMGRQGYEEIRVEELASLAGTIPYEIFCSIGRRVKRVYKED